MTPLITVFAMEVPEGYEIRAVRSERFPKTDFGRFIGRRYASADDIQNELINFAQEWLPEAPRFLDTVGVVVVWFDSPIPEPDFAELLKNARSLSMFERTGSPSKGTAS